MNSIVADFIAMENLTRKQRVPRCQRARASSIISKPLHMIEEESEPSPSSQPLKARRRHCNLSPSDIQIARDFVGLGDDDDASDREDRLLLVPPSSARFQKACSPAPSQDSFQLDFDGPLTFPHPPIPTPTSLTSRHIQSYCGSSASQPLSPASSDDEFFSLPSPKFNPRRAAIHPLVIRKHQSLSAQPGFLAPCNAAQFTPSPFTSEESSSDSESESDSEWYNNEFSKILSVRPPTIPSSATQKPRPDSIFIPHPPNKRVSRPSGQLDPAFPEKRRQSRQVHIPSYPPPPVPTVPAHLRSVSHMVPSSPTSPASSLLSFALPSPSRSPFRPPPRSSVPTDFEFEHDDCDSAFSFGLYEYDEEDGSLKSSFAQQQQTSSFREMFEMSSLSSLGSPLEHAEFDIDDDYPMMLPLSVPGTPIDLETDIAAGLEKLRAASAVSAPSTPVKPNTIYTRPLPPVPEEEDSTASISDFSFSPSIKHSDFLTRTPSRSSFDSFYLSPPASPSPYSSQHTTAFTFNDDEDYDYPTFSPPRPAPRPPVRCTIEDEERVLKSKWSSSTLNSLREEQQQQHTQRLSSRLRLFSPSKKQQQRSAHTKSPSSASSIMPPPLSPKSFLNSSPARKHQHQKNASSSAGLISMTLKGAKREASASPDRSGHYYHGGQGIRRRGSCTTVSSDTGSEDSASSSSSSGLRRKPIPIELFMRA